MTTDATTTKCRGCGCPLATGHEFCSETCRHEATYHVPGITTLATIIQEACSLDTRWVQAQPGRHVVGRLNTVVSNPGGGSTLWLEHEPTVQDLEFAACRREATTTTTH